MVNVLSLPDDLLGRLAYPEGWHDFQWWITLRLGFQAPEMGWTGPGERGLIDLNSNEGSVQACPDLIWEIPVDHPKIIYSNLAREMRAVLDRQSYLTNQKCYIIPDGDTYLLALLNAKLLDIWFRLSMPCLDDPFGGGDMEFNHVAMQHAPIAPARPNIKKRLSRLANEIQTAKEADPGADTSSLEQRIDEIVYTLYGLDKKDIAQIEETAPS